MFKFRGYKKLFPFRNKSEAIEKYLKFYKIHPWNWLLKNIFMTDQEVREALQIFTYNVVQHTQFKVEGYSPVIDYYLDSYKGISVITFHNPPIFTELVYISTPSQVDSLKRGVEE